MHFFSHRKTLISLLFLVPAAWLCAQEPKEKSDSEKKENKASVSFSYAFKTRTGTGDDTTTKTKVLVTQDGVEHTFPSEGQSQIWISADGEHDHFPAKGLTVFTSGDHDHSGHPFSLQFSPNHGFLGIESVELTRELRLHFGAPEDAGIMVGRLTEDGPAAQAGLQVGDILTHLDDTPLSTSIHLLKVLVKNKPGHQMEAQVWRDGEIHQLPVVLGELDAKELSFSSEDAKLEVLLHPSNQGRFNLQTWTSGQKPKVEWVEIDQSNMKQQLEALQTKIDLLEKKIMEQQNRDH